MTMARAVDLNQVSGTFVAVYTVADLTNILFYRDCCILGRATTISLEKINLCAKLIRSYGGTIPPLTRSAQF